MNFAPSPNIPSVISGCEGPNSKPTNRLDSLIRKPLSCKKISTKAPPKLSTKTVRYRALYLVSTFIYLILFFGCMSSDQTEIKV